MQYIISPQKIFPKKANEIQIFFSIREFNMEIFDSKILILHE